MSKYFLMLLVLPFSISLQSLDIKKIGGNLLNKGEKPADEAVSEQETDDSEGKTLGVGKLLGEGAKLLGSIKSPAKDDSKDDEKSTEGGKLLSAGTKLLGSIKNPLKDDDKKSGDKNLLSTGASILGLIKDSGEEDKVILNAVKLLGSDSTGGGFLQDKIKSVGIHLIQKQIVEKLFGDKLDQPFQMETSFGDRGGYTKVLSRVEGDEFDPCAAAALNEMDISVSIASGDWNDQLEPPPGFEKAIPIWGADPITRTKTIFAYIFKSSEKKMVVISFTGTRTPAQLLSDMRFRQVVPDDLNNYHEGILVENGFYSIYESFKTRLRLEIKTALAFKKNTQLYITGHSLGGALTTLASFDLAKYKPIVYSFASPRVGNPEFTKTYNELLPNAYRVYNTVDIVPKVPLAKFGPIVYEHAGNPVPFTLDLKGVLPNHIEAYMKVVVEHGQDQNGDSLCDARYSCCQ